MRIGVGSSIILPYEKNLITRVLNSSQISPGKYCKQFEDEFKKIHNLKHAAFVSSGTDALRIALLALKEKYGWKDGAEVLVPAVTFVATINTVIQAGLRPRLVDITLSDYMMNPWRLLPSEKRYCGKGIYERHTNLELSRVKCLVVAHLFGQPANMDRLMEAARYHKWKVVEDSCETMFVKYKGKMVGTFGDIACFSTYACHLLSTGVGGIVCARDRDLNEIVRSLANHGRDASYIPGYSKPKRLEDFIDRHFKYDRVGYSSRATELQAVLGLGQLRTYKENLRKRQENALYLCEKLKHLEDFMLPEVQVGREHAFMMFPILIRQNAKFTKRELMIYLGKNGIESRDMMPITNQPCYEKMGFSKCPQAEIVNSYGFYIGCHPELKKRDLDKIVRAFDKYVNSCY